MTEQTLKPVINNPNLYINGCNYIVSANSNNIFGNIAGTLTIFPGILRDSTNTFDMSVPSTLFVNTRTTGANGIDVGAIAVDTLYAIYILGDPYGNLSPCAVISSNLSRPVMANVGNYQYSAYRLIGYCLSAHTSAGANSDLVKCVQPFSANFRKLYYSVDLTQTTGFRLLSAGASTTEVSIDMNSITIPIVPTSLISIGVGVSFTGAVAGDSTTVYGDTSRPTQIPSAICQVATVANVTRLDIPPCEFIAGNPIFYYKNSAGSGATTIYLENFGFNV